MEQDPKEVDYHNAYSSFSQMDEIEKIGFLEWVFSKYPRLYDMATMGPNLRKRYEGRV